MNTSPLPLRTLAVVVLAVSTLTLAGAPDTGQAQSQEARLGPSDGERSDNFGSAVSVSTDGSTALVGAPGKNVGEDLNQGRAYIYTRGADGAWTEEEKLDAADGDHDDHFGASVSMSADGSTALVGAFKNEVDGNNAQGSVYVYRQTADGSWTQEARLTASDGGEGDRFGASVSMSADGSRVLVGAPEKDFAFDDNQGTAYLYTRSADGAWAEETALIGSDGSEGDRFGGSVSMSADGSTVLVGARLAGANNNNQQGRAYVFGRAANGSWTEQDWITASDGQAYDQFGAVVSLSGDGSTAVVGVDTREKAYVFTPDGPGAWTQKAAFTRPNGDGQDVGFGTPVALDADGSTALVGARYEDVDGANDQGSTYLFATDGTGSWVDVATFTPSTETDEFGSSLSVGADGSAALVGAPSEYADDTSLRGSAYVWSLPDVIASHTAAVSTDGRVEFGATGIAVDFDGISGSGDVTVTKYGDPPSGADGISESTVSDYRYEIETGGDLTVGPGTGLYFDVRTLGGIGDAANVTIYKRPTVESGTFSALSTAYDPEANTLSATTDRFSEFVLASDMEPLPVELAGLEATSTGAETVQLAWRTASETNNAGFHVQHQGPNADTWGRIGFVASKANGGTATAPFRYRFRTGDLSVGTHRFRLRQVDVDGASHTYDPVRVTLHMQEALRLRGPAPNPVRRHAALSFAVKRETQARIMLYNTLGQRVRSVYHGAPDAGETHRVFFDATGLASGVYFLRLRADGTTKTRRVTVVR